MTALFISHRLRKSVPISPHLHQCVQVPIVETAAILGRVKSHCVCGPNSFSETAQIDDPPALRCHPTVCRIFTDIGNHPYIIIYSILSSPKQAPYFTQRFPALSVLRAQSQLTTARCLSLYVRAFLVFHMNGITDVTFFT